MRLTVVLVLVFCQLQLHAGYTQGITLSVKDVTLSKVFKEITKQTGYQFFYNDQMLERARTVSIDIVNGTLEQVLDLCFKDQPFTYTLEKKTIVVKRKKNQNPGGLAIIGEATPSGDKALTPGEVRGRVTDMEGEVLEGVTVSVKGTDISTATNVKGYFELKKVPANAVLVFSFIGFERQEVKVEGRSNLEVRLKKREASILNEVVVSTGYQQIKKERFVGSVTTIDSALFNRGVSTDLLSRLDGIAPSLLFDKRGSTDRPRLQIRGTSTLSTDSNTRRVLIVLDNFPYVGDINDINPNDVDNITILRDAAAASIWGAQAGNGVIVITTKKGKYNQPFRMSYNYNSSLREKPDLFYYPQMSISDFIDVEQLLFSKGKYDGDGSFTKYPPPAISPVVVILKKQRDGLISAGEAEAQINALRRLDVRNDYDKYVYREAISQQHYLGFNGGTSQLKYALSLGYDNNQTQFQGAGAYDRYTINSNTSFKPFRTLEINAGINLSQSISKGGEFTYDAALYPYTQLADFAGNHLAVAHTYSLAFIDTVGGGKLLDWHYRPLDEMQLMDISVRSQSYRLNIGANLSLTSWLNGSVQYQYGRSAGINRIYNNLKSYFTRDIINRFYNPFGTTQRSKYPVPLGGIIDLTNSESVSHNLRGQLNFNKSWGNKHVVTALVAADVGENSSKSNRSRVYGYDDEFLTFTGLLNYDSSYRLFYLGGSTDKIPSNLSIGEGILSRNVAFAANVSYTYNNRYTLYASARKDAANVFGVNTNNRWKPLWSAGIGWDISKESFYHFNWLPSLKFRASYGYTGNVNNTISAITTVTVGSSPNADGFISGGLGDLPNPDLRWEQVGIFNLGLDFTLVNNRISGSIEWFEKRSTDVIASFPIDPTLGEISASRNIASLKGRGIDIALTTRNLRGALQWNTTFNFSSARTVVTKYYQNRLVGIPTSGSINPNVGRITWGLYSYRWAGLDPLTGDPQGYLDGKVSKNYRSIAMDSFQHHIFHGSAIPLYFGNILNSFSWKGFSFSFNISYRLAYYFRKPSINYNALFNGIGHKDYSKRWQHPGDEQFTTVPSLIYPIPVALSGRDDFYSNAEVNVERGDNIRLQDLRFGFPGWENKNRKFPVRSIHLYIYPGNINLLLWKASKSGLDPDFTGAGSLSFPPPRTWSAGINVSF